MTLKSVIESILFVAGRPVALKELMKATAKSQEEIEAALAELKSEKENSGVLILEQNKSYLMSSNPANSPTVKEFLNTELREKLTDAAMETLAIITYKQPVSRAEIEAIRGVNSQYTLRLLMMRGLIEKHASQKDARMHLYRTTHEFLQHLGLRDLKDLPDFEELTAKVKAPEGFTTATSPTSPPSLSAIASTSLPSPGMGRVPKGGEVESALGGHPSSGLRPPSPSRGEGNNVKSKGEG